MENDSSSERIENPYLGVWRGGVVAPPAAPTRTPMVRARRPSGAPPLDTPSCPAIGIPEVPGAGETEGAEPPAAGTGAAGAPNLDTNGTTPPAVPSGPALFGVRQLSLAEYRQKTADELKRLALWHTVHGKRRRNFVKKARALMTCGQFARLRRCGSCGVADPGSVRVECACDLRSCPTCARRRADVARARLDGAWRDGARPRKMSLYFLTFTLRYDPADPADLSVEGLQRRKKIVREAVGYVWKKYLKKTGRAMAIAVEVSPRGAVHIHALFHGYRPDVRVVRETYQFRAGDSPFVNCKYVQRPAKAIRELAKYMMKASSPKNVRLLRGGRGEFIDPVLAARAEVAFSGDRLFECLGAWRGLDDDTDLPEVTSVACAHCGSRVWKDVTAALRTLLKELPIDWVPRFGRAGPIHKHPQKRPEGEMNRV